MKIKTKKILTLAMSAVLMLSSLSTNVFTAHSESQQLNQTMNSDVKVSGSIGSLLSDELKKDNDNDEVKDFAIYDIDYDPTTSMLDIRYGAKSDCTLFVGFYNDDCTELIYSKTVDIEGNYINNVETAIPVNLPDYYLIKCFIVDDMKRPLCKAKTNDRYTKAVQDILEKNYDDKEFDQNNVVFFEKNDKSNFFVTKQKLHSITSTDNADHYIENVEAEEKGEYSFEKIDKIADLKKGDEVVVYTDSQNLLFIIDSIKINGDNATITSNKECDLENLCSFIKLDSSNLPSAKKAKFEVADEFKEKVDCEIIEDSDEIPSYKEEKTKKKSENPFEATLDSPTALANKQDISFENSVTIGLKELKDRTIKDDTGRDNLNMSITGQITLDITCDFSIYLSQDYKSVDYTLTKTAYLELEGKLEVNCPMCWIPLINGPFIFLSLDIYLNVSFSGKLFCSISSESTGKICSKDSNGKIMDFDDTPPKLKINGAYGSIQVAVQFDFSIGVFAKKVLSFHLKPEIGIEASINEVQAVEANGVFSEAELQFDENNQADPDTHPCIICFPGDVDVFIDISVEGVAFGQDVPANLLRTSIPLGECYCSAVLGFGFGECPNKGRSKSLSPVDKIINPFELKAVDPTATATGAVSERGYVNKRKYPTLTYDIYADGSVVFEGEGDIEGFTPTEKENKKDALTRLVIGNPGIIMKMLPPWQKFETVNLKHSNYTELPETLFLGCRTLKKVILPDSLTTIGVGCFDSCTSIEEIRIPSTVTSIGNSAFDQCTSLKEVELPPNITRIGTWTFDQCTSLEEIKVPSKVSEIGMAAFANCSSLKKIKICDSEVPLYINDMAFVDSGITSIIIPERVVKISGTAFRCQSGSCNDLKSVTINGDYEGQSTFYGLTSIESVKFGDKVTKINGMAFSGCSNIKELEITENITTIESSAFKKTGINKVTIPKSVTEIGKGAFSECNSLTDITILNPTATIGGGFIDQEKNIRVHGYKGSTAEEKARATKNIFVAIDGDDSPSTNTGVHISIDVPGADQKSDAQVVEYTHKNAKPNEEYIFMIFDDPADNNIDNAIYFDQETADENGNVTFTFNKPDYEEVSYIITGGTSSKEIEDIQLNPVDNSKENSASEDNNILLGDSNGDGKIDMSDAVLIMQMLSNPSKFKISPEFAKNADVYRPGTGITTMDALSIQKYLLSLIPELPEY